MVVTPAYSARPLHPLTSGPLPAIAWILTVVIPLGIIATFFLYLPTVATGLLEGRSDMPDYLLPIAGAGLVCVFALNRYLNMHTPGALSRSGQKSSLYPVPYLVLSVVRPIVLAPAIAFAATRSDTKGIVAFILAAFAGLFLVGAAWPIMVAKRRHDSHLTTIVTAEVIDGGLLGVVALFSALLVAHDPAGIVPEALATGAIIAAVIHGFLMVLGDTELREDLTGARDLVARRAVTAVNPAATISDHRRAQKWVSIGARIIIVLAVLLFVVTQLAAALRI